jgi:hypothetical protein
MFHSTVFWLVSQVIFCYFHLATWCTTLLTLRYSVHLRGLICFLWLSRQFYDKRLAQEVSGDQLGDEFKGYVFKIMGGCDKQGFPMKQGVLTQGRVQLLMPRGEACLGCGSVQFKCFV